MSIAIVLSVVRLDYKKKTGDEVHANVLTLGHLPRNDYEAKGRSGMVVKEFYIRDTDEQFGDMEWVDGELFDMDYLEDRFGRCHLLRCQSVCTFQTLDKLFSEEVKT